MTRTTRTTRTIENRELTKMAAWAILAIWGGAILLGFGFIALIGMVIRNILT